MKRRSLLKAALGLFAPRKRLIGAPPLLAAPYTMEMPEPSLEGVLVCGSEYTRLGVDPAGVLPAPEVLCLNQPPSAEGGYLLPNDSAMFLSEVEFAHPCFPSGPFKITLM